MDIIRRRPEGAGIQRFGDLVDDMFQRFVWDWPLATGEFTPSLDVSEESDKVVVRAELPGVKAEDIELSVQGNALMISGEKKQESKQEKENYHHMERNWGRFRRTVPLPSDVDPEKISAECREGVLTITLPKSERAKPRKIEIKAA